MFVSALGCTAIGLWSKLLRLRVRVERFGLPINRNRCGVVACWNYVGNLLGRLRYFGESAPKGEFAGVESWWEL